MYNAYLTSDYTTQVEELDNSYGTAQDWADLHEFEENELKVFYTKVKEIRLASDLKWNTYRVTIDWGLASVVDALSLMHTKNQQLGPNDTVILDEEDAQRIIRLSKKEHYKLLLIDKVYVYDGHCMIPFYLWYYPRVNHK